MDPGDQIITRALPLSVALCSRVTRNLRSDIHLTPTNISSQPFGLAAGNCQACFLCFGHLKGLALTLRLTQVPPNGENKKNLPCFVFGENIEIQGPDGKSESSWTALPKSLPFQKTTNINE